MSLYYEASSILSNEDNKGGSLKSRVFAAKDLKNPPTKVYALLMETLKWSPILKDVIERSEVLKLERKVIIR
jgi:putative methyltransferase